MTVPIRAATFLAPTGAAPARADDLHRVGALPEGFVFSREIAARSMEAVTGATGGNVTIAHPGSDARHHRRSSGRCRRASSIRCSPNPPMMR